jgi:hypothetical protein
LTTRRSCGDARFFASEAPCAVIEPSYRVRYLTIVNKEIILLN